MANFDGIAQIATDNGFLKRVNYALMVSAVAVAAEGSGVTNHALRLTYAQKVLAGTANLEAVALAVLTNASISSEATTTTQPDFAIPDADIQFAVNSLFNALSGVG